MPSLMDPQSWPSMLRAPKTAEKKSRHSSDRQSSKIFGMFKLLPMLTTGCNMAALLSTVGMRRQVKSMLPDKGITVTLFGNRRGRVSMVIQQDPHSPPTFLIELPLLTTALHKEMESGLMKLVLESESKTHRKKLAEEYVWAVYVNGRKYGYCIRRKVGSDEESYVMGVLRGVSMGAGVLPVVKKDDERTGCEDERVTYMRGRFERVVGSKDSEALYLINPDGTTENSELCIFLVRKNSK